MRVALYMSAWIEITQWSASYRLLCMSHSIWVRGLKCRIYAEGKWWWSSHSIWVRGLKSQITPLFPNEIRSHSIWVRGLKWNRSRGRRRMWRSHSIWVRGLKWARRNRSWGSRLVALYMSAWIEMWLFSIFSFVSMSHSIWVRGLKFFPGKFHDHCLRVALYMSAWIEIFSVYLSFKLCKVALYMSAWIEIKQIRNNGFSHQSRTLYECVDWNTCRHVKR